MNELGNDLQPLNPPLQQLRQEVLATKQEAEVWLKGLSADQLVWSPKAGVWNMAQVLDHMNRVGDKMLPILDKTIDTLRQQDKRYRGPFKLNLFERMFVRMVSPNPPFRLPVPPAYVPAIAPEAAENAVARFLTLQDEWLERLEAMNDYDLRAAQITSPVNRLLKGSLAAWIVGLVMHQRYHMLQVMALKEAMPRPPA